MHLSPIRFGTAYPTQRAAAPAVKFGLKEGEVREVNPDTFIGSFDNPESAVLGPGGRFEVRSVGPEGEVLASYIPDPGGQLLHLQEGQVESNSTVTSTV